MTHADRTTSYADFDSGALLAASALKRLGIRRGSRIAILSYNSDRVLQLFFAASKLGAVTVPLNSMLTERDIISLLEHSGAMVLAVGEEFEGLAASIVERVEGVELTIGLGDRRIAGPSSVTFDELLANTDGPPDSDLGAGPDDDDLATIIFSSGSTGLPKAVAKSNSSLAWSAINLQLAEPRTESSVELVVVPLSGIGFANFVLADVLAGAHVVLMRRFDAREALELIERHGVTHTFLPPTTLVALLALPEFRPSKVASVTNVDTAFAVPVRLRRGFVNAFPSAGFYYGYGSTEGLMNRTPPQRFLDDPTCVGYPGGIDEFRVADPDDVELPIGVVGEIQVMGPTVMQGYLGLDRAVYLTDDGWLKTGDLGRVGADGALHFAGRLKDMIKSGGHNVAAGEVEASLLEHESVKDVAVIGVPHDYWGEAVVALVVANESVTETQLEEHARRTLAGYKRPKRYIFVDELPMNPGGKVAKGVLVERYGDVFTADAQGADGELAQETDVVR